MRKFYNKCASIQETESEFFDSEEGKKLWIENQVRSFNENFAYETCNKDYDDLWGLVKEEYPD